MSGLTAIRSIALVSLCLFVNSAHAFQLGGVAELEVRWSDYSVDDYNLISLAGFELLFDDYYGEQQLLAVTEFGPQDVVSGVTFRASQLVVRVSTLATGNAQTRVHQLPQDSIDITIYEWDSSGSTTFEGELYDGWIQTFVAYRSSDLQQVDLLFELNFIDQESRETRTLVGTLFGEVVRIPTSYDRGSSGSRRVVRHHGCYGDSYSVVYHDPYVEQPYTYIEDEPGCQGDDLDQDTQYWDDSSDEPGCVEDDFGGSSDQYEDTESCASDEYDDDWSDSDSDDEDDGFQCAGDDLEAMAVLAVSSNLRPPSPPLLMSILRHIHIWAPLLLILFWRRRALQEAH